MTHPEHIKSAEALTALQQTVAALLDPAGCEWNRQQTHRSLVTYLVEETYELVEAIEDGDAADLREELGDVLYQVVLHAAIAGRVGEGFGLAEVVSDVDAKTRRRHPHVFGAETAAGVDDIVRLWTEAKAVEKASRQSAYDGVAVGLPALARAQKIESRRAPAAASDTLGDKTSAGVAGPVLEEAADEAAWGRSLLAEVDRVADRGWDLERALRLAVREREADLRAREHAAKQAREERAGTPQPE